MKATDRAGFIDDLDILRQLHTEGLNRVSAVVDAHHNYDELLEYRLTDQERDAYGEAVPIETRRERACAHIAFHLLEKPHKILRPHYSGFVCEGSTPNNDKEYAFFERICAPLGIKLLGRNYSHSGTIGMGRRSQAEDQALRAIAADAQQYYRGRTDLTAGLVRQLTLYSVAFFRNVVAFHRKDAVHPGVLVQANDHSPMRVAMSQVIKGLGITRVYLQHAEVTSSFPPLDFDYSVLRNARSKDVYAALGALTGQVFVLPRYSEDFAADRLTAPVDLPATVVIYPTSRVVMDALRTMIGRLAENRDVKRVVIKQHPASARQLHKALADQPVTFADTIPDEPHIAVVGNSGVTTELLHAGVPVYQCFSFDPIRPDYYGLVEKGITRQVEPDDMSRRFWTGYTLDAQWLDAFKQLDPTVDTDYRREMDLFLAEMQRLSAAVGPNRSARWMRGNMRAQFKASTKRNLVRFVNAYPRVAGPVLNRGLAMTARLGNALTMVSYLGANYLRNRTNLVVQGGEWHKARGSSSDRLNSAQAVTLVERTLCDLKDPAAWLQLNAQGGVFSDDAIFRALENLFQDRRPELGRIFESYANWTDRTPVGTWLFLRGSDWANLLIAPDVLGELIRHVTALSPQEFAKPLLERALLSTLVRCGTPAQLDAFFAEAKTSTFDTVSANVRLAILRKLYADPERVSQAIALRQRFEANASDFDTLKLRNMDYLASRPSPGWSHHLAEQRFEKLAPPGVAKEFQAVATPFFSRFRDRMRLMEVRNQADQSAEVLRMISSAISGARPLSLIRLSDGEGYLFPGPGFFSQADARNRERHWWDGELPPALSQKIIAEARRAIQSADIVGIPSVYRFIRDTSDTSRAITQSLQGRGLLQVLAGLPDILGDHTLLSEDKINVSLFGDLDNILRLAGHAQRTFIVSSVRPQYLPAPIAALPNLAPVTIPTHARTARNGAYQPNTEALPFIYDTVLAELHQVAPGDLVLVAGGIVGKIMIGFARDRGSVALDIGSVIDDWISTSEKSLR